jgi:hypothetical protein
VPTEREIRMPFDDDPELTALVERFVMPDRRYLKLLHGNFLAMPDAERARFVSALLDDAREISDEAIGVLLTSEWRSRLTAAYLVAASGREHFVPLLGDLLIESQLVYCGQAYCIALASIGTTAAAERLTAYLDRWLPDVEALYDQLWAMGALITFDRRAGASLSDRFLGANGPWDSWEQGRLDLDYQVKLTTDVLAALAR